VRVFLDSCIVIYLFQAPDPIRKSVRRAVLDGIANGLEVLVSDLTRLECRVWPLREQASELLATFDRFFQSQELRYTRLNRTVFDLATELRAEGRLSFW
jgi:predicted nucleic acid-binding protein